MRGKAVSEQIILEHEIEPMSFKNFLVLSIVYLAMGAFSVYCALYGLFGLDFSSRKLLLLWIIPLGSIIFVAQLYFFYRKDCNQKKFVRMTNNVLFMPTYGIFKSINLEAQYADITDLEQDVTISEGNIATPAYFNFKHLGKRYVANAKTLSMDVALFTNFHSKLKEQVEKA